MAQQAEGLAVKPDAGMPGCPDARSSRPWDPRGGRRGLTPQSCPLTSGMHTVGVALKSDGSVLDLGHVITQLGSLINTKRNMLSN